jgi:hypothetical protein
VVRRAHWMSPDFVFGILPTAKRHVTCITLNIDPTPHWASLSNHPQLGITEAVTAPPPPPPPVGTPWILQPSWKIIEGCRNYAALKGGSNPQNTGVITPVSDKSITHGVIQCTFYI